MKEKIIRILSEIDNEIPGYTGDNLFDAGYLDSMTVVNLVVELEEIFDIEIDAGYVVEENFRTLDAITALIEQIMKG